LVVQHFLNVGKRGRFKSSLYEGGDKLKNIIWMSVLLLGSLAFVEGLLFLVLKLTEPSVENMPTGLAAEALKLHYGIKAQIMAPIVGVLGTPLVMYLVRILNKR
jgi:formate-dependent nitrite reductase membrane component NrfD